ncbi:hypothetical protein CFC21_059373 [Triticum aestivum]|uniref:Pentacotripeptide-repeat region of PRORP domain-containing protein n=2 Tax=Triticum aestivum TaxID=4565 RepID=A0A3B6IZA1_WHEAT|nr:hypothetical protein CFC21_059373 [Triticum aestivum]
MQTKEAAEALPILDQMTQRGIKCTTISYTTLINEMLREGKEDRAKRMFDEMVSSGHKPSATTYTVFINSYCKEGRIEDAENLIVEMEREGVAPGVVTYNTFIDGCGHMGYNNRAFDTLKHMMDASCEPDYGTYCILLKHLLKGNLNVSYVDASALWNLIELDTFWQFLERMSQYCLNPTMKTFNSLIAGFCKASRIKEACVLLDHMCGKDITPNEEIYMSLIK